MKFLIAPPHIKSHASDPNENNNLLAYEKAMALSARVGLYGLILVMVLWFYIAWPDTGFNFVKDRGFGFSLLVFIGIVVCNILGHELLHLMASPRCFFYANTRMAFWLRNPKWQSTFYTQHGMSMSKWEWIWINIFPFLILTVLPFLLLMFNTIPGDWVFPLGVLAATNFYGSSQDLFQAAVILRHLPSDERICAFDHD
jgi:hypothetical protein